MKQAKTVTDGTGIYRARSGVTWPGSLGIHALCLAKEEELFQLHLPRWSFAVCSKVKAQSICRTH
jgi:hypothetical protein